MSYIFLCLTVFIMFFQVTEVFPSLAPYSPLKYTALLTLLIYLLGEKKEFKSPVSFFSVKVNKYFIAFVFFQILSASYLWVAFGLEIFNFWLRYGIVYILIVKSASTVNRIKMLPAFIVFAIAYLSWFSLSKFVFNFQTGMRAGGFGWYVNSNDLSVVLVSIVPLSFLMFEISKTALFRVLYFSLTLVFAFNILFTGSRNGLLGLFTVGMLSIILSNVTKVMRLGLVAVLCSAILGLGLATVLDRDDLSGLSGDASSESRLEQWAACARMVREHPLLGVGPFESPGEMRNYGGIGGLPPHNTIIQVFAETGIPGGLFFVLFGVSPLVTFFKRIKKYISVKEEEYILYKYFCVSLTGFWVCAFFSNRIMGYQLYILVALIVASLNIINRLEAKTVAENV